MSEVKTEEIVLLIDKREFCGWYFDEDTSESVMCDLANTGEVNLQGYLESAGFLPVELIKNFDEVKDKLDLSEGEIDDEEIREPGNRFTLKFVEDKLLTVEQREKIIGVLVENDLETIEWWKERVLRDICTCGLTGFGNFDDQELIDAYEDHVEAYEIPVEERIYPVVLKKEEKKEVRNETV